MPDPTLDSLLDQLRRTHGGEPWFGPSRARLLAGLTAAEAASHPLPGVHSVWELVLHMTAWTNEAGRRIGGAAAAEPIEGDWPPAGEPTDAAWAAALAALDRAHAALVAAATRLAPAELAHAVADTRAAAPDAGVTVAGTLVGLAQHDAYHTGQLALLRRAIERRRAAPPTPTDVVLERFEAPHEVRAMEKGRFELVRIGGLTIGRATYEPGWRWSEHVGRAVGATRCTVEHVGLVLSGTATAAFADGRVVELRAGELFYIPPEPHDSWVVGDEPYVSLHFLGADHYAR